MLSSFSFDTSAQTDVNVDSIEESLDTLTSIFDNLVLSCVFICCISSRKLFGQKCFEQYLYGCLPYLGLRSGRSVGLQIIVDSAFIPEIVPASVDMNSCSGHARS